MEDITEAEESSSTQPVPNNHVDQPQDVRGSERLSIIFNEYAVEKLNRSHTMREKPDWIPVGKEGERI